MMGVAEGATDLMSLDLYDMRVSGVDEKGG